MHLPQVNLKKSRRGSVLASMSDARSVEIWLHSVVLQMCGAFELAVAAVPTLSKQSVT